MTNVDWAVDAPEICARLRADEGRVCSTISKRWPRLPVLKADELMTLQARTARSLAGNIALIAAGTGLGEAVLHYIGSTLRAAGQRRRPHRLRRPNRPRNRVRPLSPRAATAAPRSSTCCRVRGLLNLSDFTHLGRRAATPDPGGDAARDAGGRVASTRSPRTCPKCVEALDDVSSPPTARRPAISR